MENHRKSAKIAKNIPEFQERVRAQCHGDGHRINQGWYEGIKDLSPYLYMQTLAKLFIDKYIVCA
jgi:hypothetical protein